MTSEGGSFSYIGYHIGTDWEVRCNVYAGKTPIFCVDAGSTSLAISPRGQDASKAAVEFARALAREAQKFADEMERMHAAQPGDYKAAGSDAA